MRDLRKNQVRLWYALYETKTPVLDENGDETGKYTNVYSKPVSFRSSICHEIGSAERSLFGTDVEIACTLSTTNLKLPITENSLVWYETKPTRLSDGSASPDTADYEVSARPVKGLNQMVIALKARAKNAKI